MYYIIEHQIRPNGTVNNTEVGRSTFANALAYYYERMSKLVVNTEFVSAHLMLVEENLQVRKQDDIETLYQAPEAEQDN